jgi:hypothetical protein
MGQYIVYRLDGLGKIRGSEWIDAWSDRDALERARRLTAAEQCEVWQLDRRIGRVAPDPGSAHFR